MKLKILTVAVVVGCVLGCAETKNAATETLTGRVCSCTQTELKLQTGSNEWYILPRTSDSQPCPAPGSTVTVTKPPDAQRKEGPWPCQTAAARRKSSSR